VRLDDVTCSYGRGVVLAGASLTVRPGDFVGVVGPSGSGKTTLLRALLGTLPPVSGRVARAPDLRIGYVPQRDAVDWTFPATVGEAVLMARPRVSSSGPGPRERRGRRSASIGRWAPWASRAERAEVAAVLDRLGLGSLGDRHIRDLSGGQQQRMFIARALLRRPRLLVMDEPTSGVDVRTRHELLHLLADLHAGGLSVVLTTHDLNGLAAHLPSLVCLNRRVVAEGAPRDVLTPGVLEATYGAPMDVLSHGGMPVVVERAPWGDGATPGHGHRRADGDGSVGGPAGGAGDPRHPVPTEGP
jgi:ABC-type Mn2+/Zn2+ transport system ATPase subunit